MYFQPIDSPGLLIPVFSSLNFRDGTYKSNKMPLTFALSGKCFIHLVNFVVAL